MQLSSHDSSAYLLSVPFVGYLITILVIEFIKLTKEHNSPILKREAGGPFETLVPIHQSTRNNIPEDRVVKTDNKTGQGNDRNGEESNRS